MNFAHLAAFFPVVKTRSVTRGLLDTAADEEPLAPTPVSGQAQHAGLTASELEHIYPMIVDVATNGITGGDVARAETEARREAWQ